MRVVITWPMSGLIIFLPQIKHAMLFKDIEVNIQKVKIIESDYFGGSRE